ncbi:MAG: (2Fe-2S)-binding protein [Bryobacterales bacterium]|nr:(2Fe-2S)-binding protein [Bryobacterales bacterium]
MTFRLNVNGTARTVDTEPDRPLLDVLREDLQLTGPKYGCGEGQCRACTVLVDGKALPSCVMPVRAAAGKKIVTIEGLAAGGQLTRLQQAFIDEAAMQCGYCVPGMILTATALLERTPHPTDAQIMEGMNGNLCRCCGYTNIVAAIRRASKSAREETASATRD